MYSNNYPIISSIKTLEDNRINYATLDFYNQDIINTIKKYRTTEIYLKIKGEHKNIIEFIADYIKFQNSIIVFPIDAYDFFTKEIIEYNPNVKVKIDESLTKLDVKKISGLYPDYGKRMGFLLFYFLRKTRDTGKLYFGDDEEKIYSNYLIGYKVMMDEYVKILNKKSYEFDIPDVKKFELMNRKYAEETSIEEHLKNINAMVADSKFIYVETDVKYAKGTIINSKEYEIIVEYFKNMLVELRIFENGGILFSHIQYMDVVARKVMEQLSSGKPAEFYNKNMGAVCLATISAYVVYYIETSKGRLKLRENELVKSCYEKTNGNFRERMLETFICIIREKFSEEYLKFMEESRGNWKKLVEHVYKEVSKLTIKEHEKGKNEYYEMISETYKYLADKIGSGGYRNVLKDVYKHISYGEKFKASPIIKRIYYPSTLLWKSPIVADVDKFIYVDVNPMIYCISGSRHEWKNKVCKICGLSMDEAYKNYIEFDDNKYKKMKEKVIENDAIRYYSVLCTDNTPHQIYFNVCENCGMYTDEIYNPSGEYKKKIVKLYKKSVVIDEYNVDVFMQDKKIEISDEKFNDDKFDKLLIKMGKSEIIVESFKNNFRKLGIFNAKYEEEKLYGYDVDNAFDRLKHVLYGSFVDLLISKFDLKYVDVTNYSLNKIFNLIVQIGLDNDIKIFYNAYLTFAGFTESFNITEYYLKSHKVIESRQNELRHDVEMSLTPDVKINAGFDFMTMEEKNMFLDNILEERNLYDEGDEDEISGENLFPEAEEEEGADMGKDEAEPEESEW